VEKLVHLVWRSTDHDEATHRAQLTGELAHRLLASAAGVQRLDVLTGDTSEAIPSPSILLGRGNELASVVSIWVDCIDDRAPILETLAGAAGTTGQVDQYLVTESVPQVRVGRDWGDGEPTPGMTHFSWFPKPDRLTDADFFHGWHEVHTPKTPALHPLRVEYVRDSVARVLTPGSPPIRALVAERFPTVEDYTDPTRLCGSDEELSHSVTDLPLYADFESLNSRPLFQTIIRS
jgi:hypothetical protein